MFGSRRGRPGLIGRAAHTAARTAIIAGTATAVSSSVASRQMAKAGAAAPQPAPAAAPVAAGGLTPEAIAQLRDLGALHEQGILTAEEFAAQKARILA